MAAGRARGANPAHHKRWGLEFFEHHRLQNGPGQLRIFFDRESIGRDQLTRGRDLSQSGRG
jgi:hypothetical protein